MEMTIEEAKTQLIMQKSYALGKDYVAIKVAIETMRRYQKIHKILKDDTYYEDYGSNAERFIVSAISEVVENGND